MFIASSILRGLKKCMPNFVMLTMYGYTEYTCMYHNIIRLTLVGMSLIRAC